MKILVSTLAAFAVAVVLASGSQAAMIVDTLPANNQANLSVDAAQTFTTPVLGSENLLDTIVIEGPQGDNGEFLGPFTLELYTDTDGDHSTWDPLALIASSTPGTLVSGGATLTTFTFATMPALSDSTVYGYLWTDGSGNAIATRVGLTNATAIADGTLFSVGAQVFGDAFDTAMQINTVPEPSTIALVGLGLVGLIGLRRRG